MKNKEKTLADLESDLELAKAEYSALIKEYEEEEDGESKLEISEHFDRCSIAVQYVESLITEFKSSQNTLDFK